MSTGTTTPNEPARSLRLAIHREGPDVAFHYQVDDRFAGALRVAYPFALDDMDDRMLAPIGVGVATFIGQLCLAREITLDFPASPAMTADILPLAEMLYDVRCWKDGRDLMPPPAFVLSCALPGAPAPTSTPSRAERRACLLWSGGKDSTLSALVLRKNGYDIAPLHITANARMEEAERIATDELADMLALPYQTLVYQFPQYVELSSAYALTWNEFPHYNTVPFGRDLALALLAAPFARHTGAACLSMGHEHDCKNAYFTYQGKSVPRNDVESTHGALALEAYIQRHVLADLRLLPPLAGLPEFRILHELIVNQPDVMRRISFCFWGGNCGRCSKCLRYYLAARVLGRETLLSYAVNPLQGHNCPELVDYVEQWRDEATLFRDQILYGLGRLVERADIRAGEDLLARFRDEIYPHVAGRLDALEADLMAVYTDPQLPAGFVAP